MIYIYNAFVWTFVCFVLLAQFIYIFGCRQYFKSAIKWIYHKDLQLQVSWERLEKKGEGGAENKWKEGGREGGSAEGKQGVTPLGSRDDVILHSNEWDKLRSIREQQQLFHDWNSFISIGLENITTQHRKKDKERKEKWCSSHFKHHRFTSDTDSLIKTTTGFFYYTKYIRVSPPEAHLSAISLND